MYDHNEKQLTFVEFTMPFGGRLSPSNRWVKLAAMVPWNMVEEEYQKRLVSSGQGSPAFSARMAFGALIIKERLGHSDEECVEQIRENPYLQYFCGKKVFSEERPFDPSMYTYFRKRFSVETVARINEKIVADAKADLEERAKKNQDNGKGDSGAGSGDQLQSEPEPQNQGKLLMDATCAPADIWYPTDVKLLNNAREKSEAIIDILHKARGRGHKKPRTYRIKARKKFLQAAKSKKLGGKKLRKALKAQLGFLRRNLSHIEALSGDVGLEVLPARRYRELLVITEAYRQQRWMFDHGVKRVDNRIVSLSQPHVRPIKRGKAGKETEFGAKLSLSLVEGFGFVDRISWDNFNESQDLIPQIEAYKKRFGVFPESVHVDAIYRNQKNRRFCKKHGIRLSGPKLGRPPKSTPENEALLRERAVQARQDEVDRIPVEGKFGEGKRRYGLGLVMTKLAGTSETAIAMTFLVMNLQKWLAAIFLRFVFGDLFWTSSKDWLRLGARPWHRPKVLLRIC